MEASFTCVNGRNQFEQGKMFQEVSTVKYICLHFDDMKYPVQNNFLKIMEISLHAKLCRFAMSDSSIPQNDCKVRCQVNLWSFSNFPVFRNSSSMADEKCSGKSECEIIVAFLAYHGPKPCPVELSSYMEASFTCLNGRRLTKKK